MAKTADADEEGKNATRRKSNLHLYYSAFAANTAFISCGCSLSWTSPSLPKLMSPNTWLQMSKMEASWAGSLLMLGGSFGPLLAAAFLNRSGRKLTMQCNTLLLLLGWVVLGSAKSVLSVCIGRVIQGVAVAIFFYVIPLYMGEIAEKNLRAALASSSEVFISCGYMLEYAVGPYVSFYHLAVISGLLPIITFFFFIWVPETPHYYLAKGCRSEAIRSLCWLRGTRSIEYVSRESDSIQASIDEHCNIKKGSLKALFTLPANRRALFIANGLLLLQQFSGINVVLFYAQPIFMKTRASLSSSISAMIVGAVQLISACFTPPVVKQFGFKTPLLISAIGMACAQGALGLYFFLEHKGYDLSNYGVVPVVCLVSYIFVYCLGFGPLPWAIVGEIFSPNVKSLASAICTSFSFFLAFLITKFFHNISYSMGTFAAFWIFSIFSLLAILFVGYFVPNTRGMSLEEIQDLLNEKISLAPQPNTKKNGYVSLPQE